MQAVGRADQITMIVSSLFPVYSRSIPVMVVGLKQCIEPWLLLVNTVICLLFLLVRVGNLCST
jgi:hypothetical protein